MCIKTIHVLQLIAAVTVFIVGLYICENERIIFQFRENMVKSLNDIESKCNCNPEVKQHDGSDYNIHIQNLETQIADLQKIYSNITTDMKKTTLLIKEQNKLIKELQQNQTYITADLKDKNEWISEQKLKSFIGEAGRDLVIIIDSSASIGNVKYQQSLKDVATLIGLLCPKPDPFDPSNPHYNQVAVIVFSNDAKEIFDLKKYHELEHIQQAINSIDYDSGATCTETAFDMAKQMFTAEKDKTEMDYRCLGTVSRSCFEYGKHRLTRGDIKGRVVSDGDKAERMRSGSNIKKEVLLLTDGEYNCAEDEVVISKANSLKSVADVYGLLIGVESVDGQNKLSALVNGSNSLFTVGNYNKFSHLVSKIKQDVDNGVLQCAQ